MTQSPTQTNPTANQFGEPDVKAGISQTEVERKAHADKANKDRPEGSYKSKS